MNANPETTATQPPSGSKLASFGKFWQGVTAGSQDGPGSHPTSRRITVRCQLFHQCLPWILLACIGSFGEGHARKKKKGKGGRTEESQNEMK